MLVAYLALHILSLLTSFNPQAYAASNDAASEWNITVYYTAVEKFHHGRQAKVLGCPEMGCDQKSIIGTFPYEFLRIVQEEGTGRISDGKYSGRYLCWSGGSGFWLDSAPRDAQGGSLKPWVSAAADADVMNFGATFRILNCGKDDTDNSDIDPSTCNRLKGSPWTITDRFEKGLGGKHHLDLYIGEEDQENFIKSSPKVISVKSATISIEK